MRELKFRIWNGMEMVYDVVVGKFGVFYVNPDNNGLDANDSASLTSMNTKYPDDIHVMQFTGLKDRNGKEIYEGDIIRSDFPAFVEEGNKVPESKYVTEVIWDNGEYRTEDFSPLYVHVDNEDAKVTCEIIGNLYENGAVANEG